MRRIAPKFGQLPNVTMVASAGNYAPSDVASTIREIVREKLSRHTRATPCEATPLRFQTNISILFLLLQQASRSMTTFLAHHRGRSAITSKTSGTSAASATLDSGPSLVRTRTNTHLCHHALAMLSQRHIVNLLCATAVVLRTHCSVLTSAKRVDIEIRAIVKTSSRWPQLL
ncbi:hypothetical protein HPB51_008922 [Rhipicephalus microplus]|uniref:Uncharacterized protein n=1 Tax=Rhipicephalus microplus TaxID=6941 RepID=A0A9J6E8K9_RHIMP|nr:hypothetical protein HPB51_008922 [Rhipicephalus microplus]